MKLPQKNKVQVLEDSLIIDFDSINDMGVNEGIS